MLTDFPRNILKLAGLSVKINFFSFSTTIISKYLSLFSQKASRLYRGGFQKKIILFLISREILSVSGKTPDNHRYGNLAKYEPFL